MPIFFRKEGGRHTLPLLWTFNQLALLVLADALLCAIAFATTVSDNLFIWVQAYSFERSKYPMQMAWNIAKLKNSAIIATAYVQRSSSPAQLRVQYGFCHSSCRSRTYIAGTTIKQIVKNIGTVHAYLIYPSTEQLCRSRMGLYLCRFIIAFSFVLSMWCHQSQVC